MNTPPLSPKLTPDQMHAVLTDWHAHYCDDPLYNHIQINFEDMADQLWTAEKNLKSEQEETAWLEQHGGAASRAWIGLPNLMRVA